MTIHRAIYGSLERFIGVLVEHFAGAFPVWCAPVQAVVIPIADRHVEAADELAGLMAARKIRVEVDRSDNRMQNKIRLAQEQKCHTCSSWATARSRPGPWRSAIAPVSRRTAWPGTLSSSGLSRKLRPVGRHSEMAQRTS